MTDENSTSATEIPAIEPVVVAGSAPAGEWSDDPIVAQGQMAKGLGLLAEQNPYGDSDAGERWLSGYNEV